jgi:uncharacterized membrane protein YfcA
VNTLAGGGSFLTVPLLVMLGLPATVANATNRLGVFAQSLTAMAGFRQEGHWEGRLALRLFPATLTGSWLGAVVATRLPDEWFSRIFGVVMLLALPVVLANPKPRVEGPRHALALPLEQLAYLGIGAYGGALQAGIGIPLLLALVGFSGLDLLRAATARVFITAALTAVALAQFVWAGKVVWPQAVALAVGSALGGYAAARFGARLGARRIRPFLIVCVVAFALRMLFV